jgi:hypothetical protein
MARPWPTSSDSVAPGRNASNRFVGVRQWSAGCVTNIDSPRVAIPDPHVRIPKDHCPRAAIDEVRPALPAASLGDDDVTVAADSNIVEVESLEAETLEGPSEPRLAVGGSVEPTGSRDREVIGHVRTDVLEVALKKSACPAHLEVPDLCEKVVGKRVVTHATDSLAP